MLKRIGLLSALVALATVSFPSAASAVPPTRVQMPVNDVEDLSNLCPFDLTFTGTGTITLTTYYDNAGNPISQTVHGALTHTISRVGGSTTLTSNGPAPVHVDLATGETVLTGKEFAFHVPGDGIVLGMAGRLVLAADNTLLSFAGNMVTDSTTLCAALAP